jgi:hypothetical protein
MKQKTFVSMIGALLLVIGAMAMVAGCRQANDNSAGQSAGTAAVPVESVSIDITGVVKDKGNVFTLTATVLPANATNKAVIWESSDQTVATVDGDGKVTCVDGGTATITVKTVDGNKTATCLLTVNGSI